MKMITIEERIEFITKLLIEYQRAILDGRDIMFEKANDRIWDLIEEYYNKLMGKEDE